VRDRHDVDEIRVVDLGRPPHAATGVSDNDDLVVLGDEGFRLESEDLFRVLPEAQPLEDACVAPPRAGGRIERIVRLAPLDVGAHGAKEGRDVTARERGVEVAHERHVLEGGIHLSHAGWRGRAFPSSVQGCNTHAAACRTGGVPIGPATGRSREKFTVYCEIVRACIGRAMVTP
jgi:hypothetical protein